MRSGALADAAWKDMGGGGDEGGGSKGAPFGGSDDAAGDDGPDPELVAQMEKFLSAAGKKDAEGMARAFKGACDCCDSGD
jgi:hypothetical protein